MEEKHKTLTLYLSSWQKRMLADHLESANVKKVKPEALKVINKITFSRIPTKQWVMYLLPDPQDIGAGHFNLYLTDEQIQHVVEELGVNVKVSALTISPEQTESGAIRYG